MTILTNFKADILANSNKNKSKLM